METFIFLLRYSKMEMLFEPKIYKFNCERLPCPNLFYSLSATDALSLWLISIPFLNPSMPGLWILDIFLCRKIEGRQERGIDWQWEYLQVRAISTELAKMAETIVPKSIHRFPLSHETLAVVSEGTWPFSSTNRVRHLRTITHVTVSDLSWISSLSLSFNSPLSCDSKVGKNIPSNDKKADQNDEQMNPL